MYNSEINTLLNLYIFNADIINKTSHIHLCADTDHVNAIIIRTGWRTTQVVRAGGLVPGGAMLVTPGINKRSCEMIFDENTLSLLSQQN